MEARILVASEDEEVRARLRDALQRAGHTVDVVQDASGALGEVLRRLPDALLLDPRLSDATGRELLRALHGISPCLPVVLVAPRRGEDQAPAEPGACALLDDPGDAAAVARTVELALENGRLRERLELRDERALRRSGAREIVARSAAMRGLVEELRALSRLGAARALITGEPGTGKSLLAHALHLAAGGRRAPFLHVRCSEPRPAALEAALFDRAPARALRRGAFELARGGTLFLDEVDAMPLELQRRLLESLEPRAATSARADVRLVASTSVDPVQRVGSGGLLPELHERLAAVTLAVPPLRERAEDIVPLAALFARQLARELRKNASALAPEAELALRAWRWPGNARELRNVVERAVLLSARSTVMLEDLPPEIRAGARAVASPLAGFELPEDGVEVEALEKHLVAQALARCGGNRTRAARLLGMNRDQIRYRIEKFQLERPAAPPAHAARETS